MLLRQNAQRVVAIASRPRAPQEKGAFQTASGGFTPHQDIQPEWDDYASYFISVLVTIDLSTLENGCIELAAAYHTSGLIGRKWKPLEGGELKGIESSPTRCSQATWRSSISTRQAGAQFLQYRVLA